MSDPKSVSVFGAGIAGLTVAHELARRGFRVHVYEPNENAGGFFRSARRAADCSIPSEYSWHGIGPWYHNVFDLMRQIPFDQKGSMYERALSRPIDFGLATDDGHTAFDDTWLLNVKNMFRMSWPDVLGGSYLMLKTWLAGRRSHEHYSQLNAAQAWRPYLSRRCWQIWRSCFGPWIGSDWTNVSLHTAGQFFRKPLLSQPTHQHSADDEGGAWSHGARSGWLLLKGPSNEIWFNRWVKYLESLGVEFHWHTGLQQLHDDGTNITGACLTDATYVSSDFYVLAANPFITAEILQKSPSLSQLPELELFGPLTRGGSHTQVSLRLAFREKILWPRLRTAVIAADSEFNLTLFAEEAVWDKSVDLGKDILSLWTVTACVATVPGRLHCKSLEHCTKQQLLEEVKAQLLRCEGLNRLIASANLGRTLSDFDIAHIEVWHEWTFSEEGIRGRQPKWVNRMGNQQFMPSQKTPLPNLVLAGAHTRTEVDVWSIEAAVESGRRAAQLLHPEVKVLSQYCPWWLRVARRIDDWLYSLGWPHLLDLLGLSAIILACLLVALLVFDIFD